MDIKALFSMIIVKLVSGSVYELNNEPRDDGKSNQSQQDKIRTDFAAQMTTFEEKL